MIDPSIKQGSKSIILESLRLNQKDKLYLIVQNELSEVGNLIKQAAILENVVPSIRNFTPDEFHSGNYPKTIFSELMNFKNGSIAGIILIIEWTEETTWGRLSFLKELMNKTSLWRIASMPGISMQYLAFCNCQLSEISQNCLSVFESLVKHDIAEIITHSENGNKHKLYIDLGEYKPIISDGIIDKGKWGNVPSGETFCMPNLEKSFGEIIIRGSLPNYPMKSDEWILAKINNGKIEYKLTSASSTKLRQRFLDLFFDNSGNPKGQNTNCLAELGIGVNNNIIELTGKPLFDEKKMNTIHLGFGSNSQFFGPIESKVHHDIVIEKTSIHLTKDEIYSECLIDNGEFIRNRTIKLPDSYLAETKKQFSQISINDNIDYKIVDFKIWIVYINTRNSEITVQLRYDDLDKPIKVLLESNKGFLEISKISDKDICSAQFTNLILHEILLFK